METKSVSSSFFSALVSSGNSLTRESGEASAASSRTRRCSTRRETVDDSNRSVRYPSVPVRPCGVWERDRVRSDLVASKSRARGWKDRPDRLNSEAGAFCSTSMTWKRGE
ncbi:hypothetical protein ASNO1_62730 [Corallococcus caeni]|uniref:Uncharacterized protein n=1 Tax=Corallococcus caeni TaxID=3082388 RepID=A0ABQ6R2C2_9BACT|nr:hypothetical protein ASNO1_62730 [Corallococcus sp. NO1]